MRMVSVKRSVYPALAVVLVGLLLVGVVSGTVWRHVVQAAPVAAAWLVGVRRPSVARAAAAPLFAFWLGIMVLIWLFLLGVARVVTGHFSVAEVLLTLAIGVASAAGLVVTARRGGRIDARDMVAAAMFAALQVGAMWLSLRPGLAAR